MVRKESTTQHDELGFKISMGDTRRIAIIDAPYLRLISIEKRNENMTTGNIKNTMFYSSIQVTQFGP